MNARNLNNVKNGGAIIKYKNKFFNKRKLKRHVTFDALPLLLNACVEGELELVKKTIVRLENPNEAYYSGVTALHNAVGAGHFDIVKFLVGYGCDVNATDFYGWTPLHCAASLNNLAMLKFLIKNGASPFSTTLVDHKTPAEQCDEDGEDFEECLAYLYNVQERMGTVNNREVYALFPYKANNLCELSFDVSDVLFILHKSCGESKQKLVRWWAQDSKGEQGYVQRNLLGLYPRVLLHKKKNTAKN